MRKSLRYFAIPAFALTLGVSSAALAESAGRAIDDATITNRVKSAFMNDPQVNVMRVSVTTEDGTVRLTGNADSKEQESKAISLAKEVDGVKSVEDNVTVRGTQAE